MHINILIKAIRLSPKISVFLESIYQKYSSEKVIYYCDILNHISTLRSLRQRKNKMRPKENLLLISDTQWRKRAKIEGKKSKIGKKKSKIGEKPSTSFFSKGEVLIFSRLYFLLPTRFTRAIETM